MVAGCDSLLDVTSDQRNVGMKRETTAMVRSNVAAGVNNISTAQTTSREVRTETEDSVPQSSKNSPIREDAIFWAEHQDGRLEEGVITFDTPEVNQATAI